MKNIILSTITIIAISVCSLHAEDAEIQDEAALLRQEIQKQELVLQALKEKLVTLEAKNIFEVSITSEGLSTQGNPISFNELEKQLRELLDDATILIRAEATVSYKEVVSVMRLCTTAGKNVAIATVKAEQDGAGQRR